MLSDKIAEIRSRRRQTALVLLTLATAACFPLLAQYRFDSWTTENGELTVQTAPGRGAVVAVRIPLREKKL